MGTSSNVLLYHTIHVLKALLLVMMNFKNYLSRGCNGSCRNRDGFGGELGQKVVTTEWFLGPHHYFTVIACDDLRYSSDCYWHLGRQKVIRACTHEQPLYKLYDFTVLVNVDNTGMSITYEVTRITIVSTQCYFGINIELLLLLDFLRSVASMSVFLWVGVIRPYPFDFLQCTSI